MSSRALGLLHLAMHDAWFGCSAMPTFTPYLDGALPGACDPMAADSLGLTPREIALSGAAITVLDALYHNTGRGISVVARDQLVSALDVMIANAPFQPDTLHPAFAFGQAVAGRILTLLAVKPNEIGAEQGHYEPKPGRYFFRDEPVNPVRLMPIDPDHPERGEKAVRIYHGPYYGTTVATFSVTDEAALVLAEPPKDEPGNPQAGEYLAALREVKRLGGAPNADGTERTPNQTVAAYFWAYDGANLIGTPPRLYNQIVRTIAWDRRTSKPVPSADDLDEFVRVFALANTAMADAGKFSWREKYRYEFWRPLSGVREHDIYQGSQWENAEASLSSLNDTLPDDVLIDGESDGDPFWESLGAPETNTDRVSFKPPFPAYPSGHATFGAACFQVVRCFYKDRRDDLTVNEHGCDNITFTMVSDELDGFSRDLRQPYNPAVPIVDQPGTVRTRVTRTFPGLWHAIFENAISRIFLGVHWRFDAFKSEDALIDPTGDNPQYKDPCTIVYGLKPMEMVGGVPLGIAIADQICAADMAPSPAVAQAIMTLFNVAPAAEDQHGPAARAILPAPTVPSIPEVQSANTNIR